MQLTAIQDAACNMHATCQLDETGRAVGSSGRSFSIAIDAIATTASSHQRHHQSNHETAQGVHVGTVRAGVYTVARRWVDRTTLLTRSIYSADELNEWPEE